MVSLSFSEGIRKWGMVMNAVTLASQPDLADWKIIHTLLVLLGFCFFWFDDSAACY